MTMAILEIPSSSWNQESFHRVPRKSFTSDKIQSLPFRNPALVITGYWSSIYIHKDWAGRTSMPGDIGKYRRMRVGVELLVVVTSETPEKFLGVAGRMQHDRPISKKVGSSVTSGGHDLDVELLGQQFGISITVTKNDNDEIDGLLLEYDLPPVTEPTGPDGAQVPTVNRKVIAVAKLTDVDSAKQGLYKYLSGWCRSFTKTC